MNVDKMSDVLEQFVNSEDWDQARQIVRQNPELLTDQATGLLSASIEDYRNSGRADVADYLQEHLSILERSREAGIDQAFEEANQRSAEILAARRRQLDELRPSSPSALERGVWQLLDAEDPEDVDKALADNPQVTGSEDSVNYLDSLILRAQDAGYAEALRFLRDYRDLLQAYFELPPIMVALQEFMSVPTWTEAGEVLRRNPDLLSDESLQTLDSLIGEADAQGDEETAETLQAYRQVIARARDIGPDQAIQEIMQQPQRAPAP